MENGRPSKPTSRERQLAAQSGIPLLGGPDEDELVRRRLTEERLRGDEVLAEARSRLGLTGPAD